MGKKLNITATTGEAGSRQVAAGVLSGSIEIKIKSVVSGSHFDEVICTYPDGFIRTHQVPVGDKDALKEKIDAFLYGRYAVQADSDYEIPAFEAGNVIHVEVS